MAIFNKDELNESIDLFNECADYVEGCINEEYEIDSELLEEAANYCLDILDEGSDYRRDELKNAKKFLKNAYLKDQVFGKDDLRDITKRDPSRIINDIYKDDNKYRNISNRETQLYKHRARREHELHKEIQNTTSLREKYKDMNRDWLTEKKPGSMLDKQKEIDQAALSGDLKKRIKDVYKDNKKSIKQGRLWTDDSYEKVKDENGETQVKVHQHPTTKKEIRQNKKDQMKLLKTRIANAKKREVKDNK